MSSAKWLPFCSGLSVIIQIGLLRIIDIILTFSTKSGSLSMCLNPRYYLSCFWLFQHCLLIFFFLFTLQWQHNECDGVSNHRVSISWSSVCLGADQIKHQSSASLAFVRGIHRWVMDSPHKGPVTRKMFPFHDVIMQQIDVEGSNKAAMSTVNIYQDTCCCHIGDLYVTCSIFVQMIFHRANDLSKMRS